MDDLTRDGVCLTDIFVGESLIHEAGRGLFSRKAVGKGGLVTVSPAVLIDRALLEASEDKLLMSYCIGDTRLDYFLLPLGLIAMINHGAEDFYTLNGDEVRTERANVRMEILVRGEGVAGGHPSIVL